MDCVQSILDFLFSRLREAATRELSYLTALEDNIQSLANEMTHLKDARDDLKTKVEVAEGQQSLARTHQVDRWLQRVGALEAEAATFEEEARQKDAPRLESCSPDRCWSSYKLGKRAAKLLAAMRELKSEGTFDTVAEKLPPEQVLRMPSTSTVGMDSMMEMLRGFLRDDKAGAVGVYGPGGSGKTTLLRKLNNELLSTAEWDFNLVVFVVVSNGDPDSAGDASVDKIQQEIGERLELPWQENESRQSRAAKVFHALEDKKFVLLLDDLWKPVDLEQAGVPLPSRRNRCKVVFSTRSEGLCSEMGAHHKMEVKCLGEEEAWDLFTQNAELETKSSHPQILQLAMGIVAECGGLPLALIVVGRALASRKTVQEWKHAVTALQKWPSEIPGMAEKVLSRLRFSYDNLPNDTLRSCFLYCSLFPEDYSIRKKALVDYWVGEGYLGEYGNDIDEARNKGYDLIGELQSMCLLEDGDDPESLVKMHDVVRDLALWIASEEGRKKNRFLVHAGVGLKEMVDAGKWAEAERISMMKAKAFLSTDTETPICPALLTLMLQGNWGIRRIPDGFFSSMPVLRVLDLSNTRISVLPLGMGLLAELQYLNLSGTGIYSLPDELSQMKKLKQLDLSHTNHLGSIPSNVMLGLSSLQVLNVFKSSYGNWKLTGSGDDHNSEVSFEDLESMEQLRIIGISIHSGPSYDRYLRSDVLPGLTHCLYLKHCDGLAFMNVTSFGNMRCLKKLYVHDIEQLEEFVIGAEIELGNGPLSTLEALVLTGLERSQIRSDVFMPRVGLWSLRYLEISFCHKLENITWVLKLQCLEEISVSFCDGMEDIIDCADEEEEEVSISFPKLKTLKLSCLKILKNICGHVLQFPSLESLHVSGCQKLNKLPLGAQSGKILREIRGEEEWWNGLEWENWGVRSNFLPYFKLLR